jgi:branched-chain amino acid transport system permease protein
VVSAYVERWNMVLGIIFVCIITFMPEGLVPGSVRMWRLGWTALRARVRAPAVPSSQGQRP